MSKLSWGGTTPQYEYGIDHGVVYSSVENGIVWNGLLSVDENLSSEVSKHYLDGIKLKDSSTLDDFSASISSHTYPTELDNTLSFMMFSYRTKISDDHYRIHLVYNPIFAMSDKDYNSLADTPDVIKFQWELTSTPITVVGYAPISHLILEISVLESWFVEYIEELLYGSTTTTTKFPSPSELIELSKDLDMYGVLLILDHGDGSWTAIGSDDMVTMIDDTSFAIDSPSAIFVDSESYTLSSL